MAPALTQGADVRFQDIEDSYARTEITSLADADIISGYEDHTFRPFKTMTRAELAKTIALTMGLKEDAAKVRAFRDVDPSSWYSGYIGALAGAGITQGSSDTAFSPDAGVTREQLVVLFIRALGLEGVAKSFSSQAEVADWPDISEWARPYVALALSIGFIDGMQDTDGRVRFNPKAHAERQALARLAYAFKTSYSEYVNKAEGLAAQPVSVPQPAEEPSAASGSAAADASTGSESEPDRAGNDDEGAAAPIVSVAELLASGTVLDDVTIGESGVYGPQDSGNPTTITGTLTVDPGPDGTVSLQNIVMGPQSSLEVRSGDEHSVKLMQTVVKQLRVNAVNNGGRNVRIETRNGTEVETTEVQSQAVLESSSLTGKLGMIKLSSAAAGKTLTLRGNIDTEVSVDAPGSSVELAPPSAGNPLKTLVKVLSIRANSTIVAGTGTSLSSVQVSGTNTTVGISGQGAVNSVTVDSAATGTVLNIGAGAAIQSLRLDSPVVVKGDAEAIAKLPANSGSGTVAIDDEVKADVKAVAIKAIEEAIEAIGEIKQYAVETEKKINEAAAQLEAARSLYNVKDTDISNLHVLDRARHEIILYQDVAQLEIGYASGDDASSITGNVGLKTEGSAQTAVSWASDKPAFIQNDGTVNRPAAGRPDEIVTLTATLSRLDHKYAMTKTFVLTVKALSKPPKETPDTEAPDQVTGLRALTVLEDQVALAWNAAKDNVATVGYSVYVNDVKYRDVSSESATVFGLSPATAYSFKVRAFDAAGHAGAFSDAIAVMTQAAALAAPGSVTNLAYSDRTTSVTLNWAAPANAQGTVTYAVYRDGVFLANTSSTSMDIAGLTPGTLYQMVVKAFNEAGYSAPAVIQVRTAPKLTVTGARLFNSKTGVVYGNVPRLSDGRLLIILLGARDADSLLVTIGDSASGNTLPGVIDYHHAGVSRKDDSAHVASGLYKDAASGTSYLYFSLDDAKNASQTQSSVTINGLTYEISSTVYPIDPIIVTLMGL